MSAHNFGPVTLSIPNGGTDSPALSSLLSPGQLKALFGACVGFTVVTPSALTGTCSIQVVPVEGGSGWVTLQDANTDIALGAGKAANVNSGAFRDMRIHSTGAEAAQRDFVLSFQLNVTRM